MRNKFYFVQIHTNIQIVSLRWWVEGWMRVVLSGLPLSHPSQHWQKGCMLIIRKVCFELYVQISSGTRWQSSNQTQLLAGDGPDRPPTPLHFVFYCLPHTTTEHVKVPCSCVLLGIRSIPSFLLRCHWGVECAWPGVARGFKLQAAWSVKGVGSCGSCLFLHSETWCPGLSNEILTPGQLKNVHSGNCLNLPAFIAFCYSN